MAVATAVDHEALLWAEIDDLGGLLHELEPDEWNRPSLCDGWRVRDVVGHIEYGHTTPMLPIVGQIIRYRGNMTKGSYELSIRWATDRSPADLVEIWDRELVEGRSRKGIARTIKWTEGFLDHLIHQQDIRRPLERPRTVPADRLAAALDLLPTIKTPLFATKPIVAGLRLHATDIDHAVGDGPAVAGPAEALVLAAAGRQVALAELEGDGLATLTERLGG